MIKVKLDGNMEDIRSVVSYLRVRYQIQSESAYYKNRNCHGFRKYLKLEEEGEKNGYGF